MSAAAPPASVDSAREAIRARVEKCACALVAVAGTLERRRPLGGAAEEEFLALLERVRAADPALQGRLLSEPAAYFSVRVIYQLTATVVAGAPLAPIVRAWCAECGLDEPRAALAHALEEGKRLALALELLRGGDVRLASPLAARLPFAIPASRFSLEGEGAVELLGLEGGALLVREGGAARPLPLEDGARAGPATVRRAPVVDLGGGGEIRLQPSALNMPGVDFKAPLLAAGHAYQVEHAPLLRRAVELARRHAPLAHALLGATRVVALKPRRAGSFTNVTLSHLPGAQAVSTIGEPHELADTLIHELHHDVLFAIEEGGAFFEGDAQAVLDENRHYSPWRPDPRNLHGILHGAFVHAAVAPFWAAVARDPASGGALLAYARDRCARYPRQIAVGIAQVLAHGRLTPAGRAVVDDLGATLASLEAELGPIAAPSSAQSIVCDDDTGELRIEVDAAGARMTVRDSLLAHARRADPRGTAAPALAHAGLAS